MNKLTRRNRTAPSVLISGASFAGLTAAWWMNKLGYSVTVVEIAKLLRKGGTPVNIRDGVIDVVRRMNLLERIKSESLPFRPMTFLDAHGSARLTQKVTLKNVVPETDAMLVIAYQLKPHTENELAVTPTIVDLEVFSMIELVETRDQRLKDGGGRWFGNYETPCIISKKGAQKLAAKQPLDVTSYGRKESEGKDFNEDTNFGKLKRIPHEGLQTFLKKCIALGVGQEVSLLDEEGDEEVVPEPIPDDL